MFVVVFIAMFAVAYLSRTAVFAEYSTAAETLCVVVTLIVFLAVNLSGRKDPWEVSAYDFAQQYIVSVILSTTVCAYVLVLGRVGADGLRKLCCGRGSLAAFKASLGWEPPESSTHHRSFGGTCVGLPTHVGTISNKIDVPYQPRVRSAGSLGASNTSIPGSDIPSDASKRSSKPSPSSEDSKRSAQPSNSHGHPHTRPHPETGMQPVSDRRFGHEHTDQYTDTQPLSHRSDEACHAHFKWLCGPGEAKIEVVGQPRAPSSAPCFALKRSGSGTEHTRKPVPCRAETAACLAPPPGPHKSTHALAVWRPVANKSPVPSSRQLPRMLGRLGRMGSAP